MFLVLTNAINAYFFVLCVCVRCHACVCARGWKHGRHDPFKFHVLICIEFKRTSDVNQIGGKGEWGLLKRPSRILLQPLQCWWTIKRSGRGKTKELWLLDGYLGCGPKITVKSNSLVKKRKKKKNKHTHSNICCIHVGTTTYRVDEVLVRSLYIHHISPSIPAKDTPLFLLTGTHNQKSQVVIFLIHSTVPSISTVLFSNQRYCSLGRLICTDHPSSFNKLSRAHFYTVLVLRHTQIYFCHSLVFLTNTVSDRSWEHIFLLLVVLLLSLIHPPNSFIWFVFEVTDNQMAHCNECSVWQWVMYSTIQLHISCTISHWIWGKSDKVKIHL